MNPMDWLLPVAAATLHVVAYVIYNIQSQKKMTDPNPVSWAIWSFIALLNALTFRDMNGSWLAALQFFTGSVASVVTFILILNRGGWKIPDWKERLALSLGCAAGIVWLFWHKADWANMMILIALGIGFIPMYRGVWKKPSIEKPLAWNMWAVAFLVTFVHVLLQDKPVVSWIMPISGALMHAGVATFTQRDVD